jgi:hypothetical protein
MKAASARAMTVIRNLGILFINIMVANLRVSDYY